MSHLFSTLVEHVVHTWYDLPGGSTWCGQRTFPFKYCVTKTDILVQTVMLFKWPSATLYGSCLCFDVDGSVGGGKGRKLKVVTAAAELTQSSARESIFDTMLSGPRPVVTVLILWTDTAQRHLAFILRRVLQEGFQVVGLKLHVSSTTVKNAVNSDSVICWDCFYTLFLSKSIL